MDKIIRDLRQEGKRGSELEVNLPPIHLKEWFYVVSGLSISHDTRHTEAMEHRILAGGSSSRSSNQGWEATRILQTRTRVY